MANSIQSMLEGIQRTLERGLASAEGRSYADAPIDAGSSPFIWDEDEDTQAADGGEDGDDGVAPDEDGDESSSQVSGNEEGHPDFGSLIEVALPEGECDTFSSLTAFLRYIARPIESKLGRASQEEDGETTLFTKTQTYQEAVDLAERGWPEGIALVKKMSARLSEKIVKRLPTPEVRYDVTGDCIDIGRHVSGEPEDFMYTESVDTTQRPKIIHIVASVGALGNVSPESMMARGAGVVALVDALEQQGRRVIVDVVSPNLGSNVSATATVRVRVKEANAPVNMASLVFTLAHPAMLRRLVFSWREHMPDDKRIEMGYFTGNCGKKFKYGGYGQSVDLAFEDRGDIYVDSLHGGLSEREVERQVLRRIAEAGIIVEKERAHA